MWIWDDLGCESAPPIRHPRLIGRIRHRSDSQSFAEPIAPWTNQSGLWAAQSPRSSNFPPLRPCPCRRRQTRCLHGLLPAASCDLRVCCLPPPSPFPAIAVPARSVLPSAPPRARAVPVPWPVSRRERGAASARAPPGPSDGRQRRAAGDDGRRDVGENGQPRIFCRRRAVARDRASPRYGISLWLAHRGEGQWEPVGGAARGPPPAASPP